MRLVSALDWAKIFESSSLVDAALRAELGFAKMDCPARNRYRHEIEELARGSGRSELDVVQRAIAAAKRSGHDSATARATIVERERESGYYLIAHGRPEFEKELGFSGSVSSSWIRAGTKAGNAGYVAGLAVILAITMALPLIALA